MVVELGSVDVVRIFISKMVFGVVVSAWLVPCS